MNVLVDTSVWSVAVRRSTTPTALEVQELAELIAEGRVVMLGAIRQELLSSVKTAEQYAKLRQHLRAFSDMVVDTHDYEAAAGHYNSCRRQGVQGSNTDFLVCAIAISRGLSVFTVDKDFDNFAKVLKFKRHQPR